MDSKREELKRLQEESASPFLKRKGAVGMNDDDNKERNSNLWDLEEEGEGHISVGTSTGDLPHFTPRSSQADPVTSTPFQPTQTGTSFFPFPVYTWTTSMPLTTFCTPSPNDPMDNTALGDLQQLPFLGHSNHVAVVITIVQLLSI